ncbi:MAG: zf-HC2 domain-containing protein, partial [Acidobacteria bacterium]|nr:zf-HC2 domain-containing protein [Acidobacteriota bacterium]
MKRTSRRDESLERLLKESLQAPWQTPASGPCPDAEVLAAWTDGALEGRELAMTREHVAGCVSCQATLAVLARTAPPEATPLPWWQQMPTVRWLVPVAATATAIAIWVAVPREEYTRPAQETTSARESAPPQPESLQSAAQPKVAIAEDSANRAPQADPRPTTTASAELRLDTAEKAATGDVSERPDAASAVREREAVAPREQT